jgi:hypothetical protein
MATEAPVRRDRMQIERDLDEHLLPNIPQTIATLARKLGYEGSARGRRFELVADALNAKGVRKEAKRVEGGWVTADSTLDAVPIPEVEEVEFPYEFKVVGFGTMFVDASYQRPLTNFAKQIENGFDPVLFGTLTLSDRGKDLGAERHAIIDGQTRWTGARNRGIRSGPSVVFTDLTPADEASIFWRLQKNRRGMLSLHRFKAQMASGDTESQAIADLAEGCGLPIGESGIRAVGALETCYRRDAYLLERTLIDLHAAWPKGHPESKYIRGLHYFFTHFPVNEPKRQEDVDDEVLVRRLSVAGRDGLDKLQIAARQLSKGTPEKFMAMAIESCYRGRGNK